MPSESSDSQLSYTYRVVRQTEDVYVVMSGGHRLAANSSLTGAMKVEFQVQYLYDFMQDVSSR